MTRSGEPISLSKDWLGRGSSPGNGRRRGSCNSIGSWSRRGHPEGSRHVRDRSLPGTSRAGRIKGDRMNAGLACQLRRWLAPPHPTWQSRASRNRVREFLGAEELRAPGGVKINVGSASRRFGVRMLNLDLNPAEEVDVLGDLLRLPLRHGSVDTLVCTGVLEHVSDPHQAVAETYRVLKFGGRVFVETPFMQTVHASPDDYSRWTPSGLRQSKTSRSWSAAWWPALHRRSPGSSRPPWPCCSASAASCSTEWACGFSAGSRSLCRGLTWRWNGIPWLGMPPRVTLPWRSKTQRTDAEDRSVGGA